MHSDDELLLDALTRDRRTRRPPGYDIKTELKTMSKRIDRAFTERQEREKIDEVRSALGDDILIPYGDFLKANNISYEVGQRLRDEGTLKVLRVRGKLMVRLGHAKKFVRKLPLAK